jgi:AraC-like DNA-binding protein
MLLAQRDLRSSDTRIRSLALQLGYSSESAFSSAFKRHVGESPLSYRSKVTTGKAR